MPAGRDDDGLSWDGDDDPTLDTGAPSDVRRIRIGADTPVAEPVELPEGFTAVGKGSADVVVPSSAARLPQRRKATERSSIGNAALLAIGVIGGIYLLYSIGWIIGGLRLQEVAFSLVSPVGYEVALWLAVLAPPIWFGTVFVLTAHSKAWVRFVWLALGVAPLVPWPLIMTGGVA